MKKFSIEFTVTERHAIEVEAENRCQAVSMVEAMLEANPDDYLSANPDVETQIVYVS